MGAKSLKPRGRMTAYAYFMQTCREEYKRRHPEETVIFAEFSKKCGERWKTMGEKERRRFDDMASRDKIRYHREMADYTPKEQKPKRKKDPNAPKRALSAFLFFCQAERPAAKEANPSGSVGDIAKVLGKKWEVCKDKSIFEEQSAKDKRRYEKAKEVYLQTRGLAPSSSAKRRKVVAPVKGGGANNSNNSATSKSKIPAESEESDDVNPEEEADEAVANADADEESE